MEEILIKIFCGFIGGILGGLITYGIFRICTLTKQKTAGGETPNEIIVDEDDVTVIETSLHDMEETVKRNELIRRGMAKATQKFEYFDGKVGDVIMDIMSKGVDGEWDIETIKKKFAEVGINVDE